MLTNSHKETRMPALIKRIRITMSYESTESKMERRRRRARIEFSANDLCY